MVEFGLKLEDNKVADWSDKYLDYEKLKEILKKAKNAMKKRDDLMKRKPDLAAEIEKAFKEGTSRAFTSPPPSYGNLDGLGLGATMPISEENDEIDESSHSKSHRSVKESEKDTLLDQSQQKYGSETSLSTIDSSMQLEDSFGQKLYSTVSVIFSKSRYETYVRSRLQEVEDCHAQFETELLKEVRDATWQGKQTLFYLLILACCMCSWRK